MKIIQCFILFFEVKININNEDDNENRTSKVIQKVLRLIPKLLIILWAMKGSTIVAIIPMIVKIYNGIFLYLMGAITFLLINKKEPTSIAIAGYIGRTY